MQNIHNLKTIQQIIAAFLISLLLALGVTHISSLTNHTLIIVAVALSLIILPFLIFIVLELWERFGLNRLIIYAFIVSSFFGPGLISLKVGPISLFPYRIFLPVAIFIFLHSWYKSKSMSLYGNEPVKPVLIFLLTWIAFAILSLLWVQSLSDGLKDIFFLVSGIFFIFLFTFLFKKRDDYIELLYAWVLVMGFMVAIGYWNYLTKQQLPVSRLSTMGAYVQHRPTAVFANENDYASYLALSFFFAFAVFHRYKPGVLGIKSLLIRLAAGFLVLSAVFQIYVSESRANLLSLFLGLVFWFLFFTKLKEKRYLVMLGLIGFTGAYIFLNDLMNGILQKVGSQIISAFTASDNAIASTDIRINLLKNASIFIADSFGLGIGAGNIEYYMKNFAVLPTDEIVNIHNWWAEIFVHYGIIIFIGYVLLYIWMIVSLYNLYRESDNWVDRMTSQALSTSLVAFSLASISPSSFMTLNYSWILVAFAVGYINYRYKNKGKIEGAKQ